MRARVKAIIGRDKEKRTDRKLEVWQIPNLILFAENTKISIPSNTVPTAMLKSYSHIWSYIHLVPIQGEWAHAISSLRESEKRPNTHKSVAASASVKWILRHYVTGNSRSVSSAKRKILISMTSGHSAVTTMRLKVSRWLQSSATVEHWLGRDVMLFINFKWDGSHAPKQPPTHTLSGVPFL